MEAESLRHLPGRWFQEPRLSCSSVKVHNHIGVHEFTGTVDEQPIDVAFCGEVHDHVGLEAPHDAP